MRSMPENLILTLAPARATLPRRELAVLQRSSEGSFDDPEVRALADVGDSQGVGGKHEQQQKA
jgi:hypothetical protein